MRSIMVIDFLESTLQHDPHVPIVAGKQKGDSGKVQPYRGVVCGGGRRGPSVRYIREDDRNESLCHKVSHRLKQIARPLPDRRINVCLLFPYPKL